ncbi:MAG: DegT/DnrJ/EryC1/StrS family aminotransferase, partial [Planctomycetaceae bacterium]|nr:DegT/DnrJ/EryC1/StrS family aminotransferase [Planctomycetaceae bacterium]
MPEKIPPFDYRIELQCIRTEIDEAIARVLDSGNLILGPEVEAFEQDFARLCEIEFAVGVASGTDALILALKVLNIGHNDIVITVANTAVPTVSAIRAVGAIPRFVDIDPRTLQMCPRALSSAIRSDVRCIIPVHLHGHPADIISIRKIAEECNIPVIADCAQAHGATVNRISVGQLGDICCFSFYPTKNLGAFGDGGMCVTSSPDLAARLR